LVQAKGRQGRVGGMEERGGEREEERDGNGRKIGRDRKIER
jgi:hypothetical protein